MPPPKQARRWSHLLWLLLLPIPVLWVVLDHYGVLRFFEEKTVDWRFQWRGEQDAPVNVVYVDVDSLSLSEIGNMPWSRFYYARMAEALIDAGKAKAVGFDFVFSDTGIAESVDVRKLVQGNLEFGRYLYKNPPVALAASYAGYRYLDINGHERERTLPLIAFDTRPIAAIEPPEIPAFRRSLTENVYYNPPVVGLIDTLNNGARVVPAWAPNNTGRDYFHLALELVRLYWGMPYGSLQVRPDRIDYVWPDGRLQASVPLRHGQLLDINWFTRWRSKRVKHFEFSRVYALAEALKDGTDEEKQVAREFFAEGAFKDAVVLIGPVDPMLQDYALTPLDSDRPVPKVSVHGNLVKTIVSGRYLRRLPTWHRFDVYGAVITLLLTLVVTALALVSGRRMWHSAAAKATAAMLLAGYVIAVFELFRHGQWILPLTAPVGAALMTSFVGFGWQVVEEQRARGRIKGMFGTYLSPVVVEKMIASGQDPELGGHDAEITAYFSDIQSFSSFSEVMPSAQLGDLLNEYLTACTDLVQAESGTLDKYIGDAVVAMFGAPVDAPDHAYRACVASQVVQRRLAELRAKWRAEGDRWPKLVHNLRTRIGLNTGLCMIGNMGSRSRFNYTMMGDNVNLAARMESGAKSWGVYTMCTEATKLGCDRHAADRFVFRPLGRIVVKGRTQPVPIFEIVGFREDVTDRTRECLALFEAALAKYYARDWTGALELLARSAALEPNQIDPSVGIFSNPSAVYADIVRHAQEDPPPADWDGRYVMKEK